MRKLAEALRELEKILKWQEAVEELPRWWIMSYLESAKRAKREYEEKASKLLERIDAVGEILSSITDKQAELIFEYLTLRAQCALRILDELKASGVEEYEPMIREIDKSIEELFNLRDKYQPYVRSQLSWGEVFSSEERVAELIADVHKLAEVIVKIENGFNYALTELKKAETFSKLGQT